jgi:hypothetical protein
VSILSSTLEDREATKLRLASQLEEKVVHLNVLQTRFDKQNQQMNDKNLVIEDLKESVALKITVADDL